MSLHIGKNFVPPDVPGKVTGEIKYAEDYKAEGMVFARLLTSPLPSGRVVSIDASEALRMDGVLEYLLRTTCLQCHPLQILRLRPIT